MNETFTLKEVNELLQKRLPRYAERLTKHDSSGFEMGERNMARIIDEFLEHGGNVRRFGENGIQVDPVGRKDLKNP